MKRFNNVTVVALAPLVWLAPVSPASAQQSRAQTGTAQSALNRDDDSEAAQPAASSGVTSATQQVQSSDSQRPFQPDRIERDAAADTPDTATRRRPDDVDEQQIAARPARPSEFELFASQIADRQIRRFGAELLLPQARGYATPATTAIPLDYRINPGDRLLIGLAGSIEADNLRVTVDSEGRIFVPRIGAVRVGGVRYGDLQATVSSQVSRQYRGFRISVAVERLHGITVYVTGFATRPGSYTVSSLSTLVNAVLAAGGPSGGGSFRSIQLRRGGRVVSDFDLYDFLLRGDKSADALLQDGDVIFVAPVGAQVAVIGSANNEAVFEARPSDTLTDVLLYAGGVNTAADMSRLLALDPLNLAAGWQQVSPEEASRRIAVRAQVVRVLSDLGIARPLQAQSALVTLSGEVAKPGRYFVPAGTSLSQVVAQAGGYTSDAFVFGTVLTRDSLRTQQRDSYQRAVNDVETLLTAAPLTSALSESQDAGRVSQLRSLVLQLRDRQPDGRLVLDVAPDTAALPDMAVQNNDTVYIPPRPVGVGVFGSVPGANSYQYRPGVKIGDYIRQAGDVQKLGDRKHIFVVRANGTVLAKGVLGKPALPGDLIYVPINPSRGEFWRKLSILSSTLFTGAATTAALIAVSK